MSEHRRHTNEEATWGWRGKANAANWTMRDPVPCKGDSSLVKAQGWRDMILYPMNSTAVGDGCITSKDLGVHQEGNVSLFLASFIFCWCLLLAQPPQFPLSRESRQDSVHSSASRRRKGVDPKYQTCQQPAVRVLIDS